MPKKPIKGALAESRAQQFAKIAQQEQVEQEMKLKQFLLQQQQQESIHSIGTEITTRCYRAIRLEQIGIIITALRTTHSEISVGERTQDQKNDYDYE